MAELVCGFLMPHDPLISAITMAAPAEKRDACLGAFEEITKRIRAAKVDTVIVIGDDHATVNGPSCMPTAMIAVSVRVGRSMVCWYAETCAGVTSAHSG